MTNVSTRIASTGLLAIGALHVLWATGSPWPLGSRQVSATLSPAATFVVGRPHRIPWLSRIGSAGVVAVLTSRGALGLAGRTDIVSPDSVSERFRRLDRRFYSPLCLTLAALALPAVSGSAR